VPDLANGNHSWSGFPTAGWKFLLTKGESTIEYFARGNKAIVVFGPFGQ